MSRLLVVFFALTGFIFKATVIFASTSSYNSSVYREAVSGFEFFEFQICTPPTIVNAPTDTPVCEGSIATFSVSATGTNLSYQWQQSADNINFTDITDGGFFSGATTASLNVQGNFSLEGTYYRANVIESLSCNTLTNSAKLNVLQVIISSSSTPSTSCDVNSGSATINVDSGSPLINYNITWYQGIGTSGAVIGTNAFTVLSLASGDYTAEVTNVSTNCTNTITVNVPFTVLNPILVELLSSSGNTFCDSQLYNGSASILVNGSTDGNSYSVQWFDSFANQIPNGTTFVISNLGPGMYYVIATEKSSNCESAPFQVDIPDLTVNPTLSLSTIANTSCVSSNGAISTTVDPVSGSYSFSWSTPSGFTSTSQNISALAADTYTLLVKDNVSGCTNSVSSTVLDNLSNFTNLSITGTTTVCMGTSTDIAFNFTGGVAPFTVNIDNGVGTISNYTSGQAITVSPTTTTTYKVVSLVDANGCPPASLPSAGATVTVNTLPTAPTGVVFSNITNTSGKVSWVNGNGQGRIVVVSEASAVSNVPVNGINYTANSIFGTGQELIAGSGEFVVYKGSFTSVNISGLSPGTNYFVAVYEYNGTCFSANSLVGNFLTNGCSIPPDVTAQPSSETICDGGTTAITLTSTTPNVVFNWTASGVGVSGQANGSGSTIAQTLSLSGNTQQQVTYTITPVSGTCQGNSITVVITVQPPPTPFSVTGGGSVCVGSAGTVPIGLDGSTVGITYNLFQDGTQIQTLPGNGGALAFSPVNTAGEYTVIGDNILLGCSSTMFLSAIVTEDPPAILTGTILGNPSVCDGESGVTYSVTDPGNILTFNWTLSSGFTIVSGAGTSSISVDVTPGATGGTISVTGTNGCGTSNPLNLNITVIPGFTVDIVAEPEIWAGRSTNFSAVSSASISSVLWNFGDGNTSSNTAPSYTYSSSGSFTVAATVTSSDNCTQQGTLVITVGELAKVSIKNVVTPNGDGANDVLFIENLELYPGSELLFLDRWGKEIVKINDYQNDWDMTVNGQIVPSGNYICLIKLTDGEVYTMTVTVIK
ncbi:MAG: gliding motility-associated C-terminal domain-containing protein [Cyclobacteriaceae bacterium]|nr:gliding motility-associated C-terminal domain-containing protein [Cyclobacteriaceae bacterium]